MASNRRPAGSRPGPTRVGAATPQQPRLWHLLLWMTGCAVYFGLTRHLIVRSPDNPAQMTLLVALALYTGLCWTGAALALIQIVGVRRPALEPGTWLLFSLGCILAIDLGVEFLPAQFAIRPEAIQLSSTCLALTLPALSRRMPGTWKSLFAILALLMAGQLIWLVAALRGSLAMPDRLLYRYVMLRSLLGLAWIGATLLRDQQAGRRYGWLHWMGITCAVIWLLLVVVMRQP